MSYPKSPNVPRQNHQAPLGQQNENIDNVLRKPQRVQYFNKSIIRKDLLADSALDWAKKLSNVPPSQLRRFYKEVMNLKRRIELSTGIDNNSEEDIKKIDDEVVKEMMLIRAKAAYTYQRSRKYGEDFLKFFNDHAFSVENKKDFMEGFQPHFEAVMAFHKVYAKGRE